MGELERELRTFGFRTLAGADEVGRGCLAGPVVAAAVVLDCEVPLFGLDDSKAMSVERRLALCDQITARAAAISISVINRETIDQINILEASRLAMTRAVDALSVRPEVLLLDAVEIPWLEIPQVPVTRGDARVCAIAAASIVAKVYRDFLMSSYHELFPEYDFEHNKGYATASHREALRVSGPSPIHRRSFSPLKSPGLFD